METAAVLTRVAPSFIRFGHFEHFAHTANDAASLRALTDAVVLRWANLQPEAASGWVKDLPDGTVKDRAINGLTDWLVHVNPEPDYAAALSWAARASPDLRYGMYRRTLAAWNREDPAAARAAVASLPVSSQEITRLRELFP